MITPSRAHSLAPARRRLVCGVECRVGVGPRALPKATCDRSHSVWSATRGRGSSGLGRVLVMDDATHALTRGLIPHKRLLRPLRPCRFDCRPRTLWPGGTTQPTMQSGAACPVAQVAGDHLPLHPERGQGDGRRRPEGGRVSRRQSHVCDASCAQRDAPSARSLRHPCVPCPDTVAITPLGPWGGAAWRSRGERGDGGGRRRKATRRLP